MAHTRFPAAIKNLPNCRYFGILHKDGVSENDQFINVDIRVMGQTVLLGWIQILQTPSGLPRGPGGRDLLHPAG